MEPSAEQQDEPRAAEFDNSARGEGMGHGVGGDARGPLDFERAWVVAACFLLFASAALLYLGRPNAAFVAAALGISAWFLNMRTQIKRKHDLVKRGGRNWVPRGSAEDAED